LLHISRDMGNRAKPGHDTDKGIPTGHSLDNSVLNETRRHTIPHTDYRVIAASQAPATGGDGFNR
jgi:hypothetical protein